MAFALILDTVGLVFYTVTGGGKQSVVFLAVSGQHQTSLSSYLMQLARYVAGSSPIGEHSSSSLVLSGGLLAARPLGCKCSISSSQ